LVSHANAEGDEEDTYMVDYAGFSVVAIQAIKEQQAIMEQQKAEKDELEKLVKELLERVESLENE